MKGNAQRGTELAFGSFGIKSLEETWITGRQIEAASRITSYNVCYTKLLRDIKNPIVLESMDFPEPVIGIAVEPKSQKDIDKLSNGLAKLAEEDPTFQVNTDPDSGQTVIRGMGELHLEIIIDRLRREFKVECNQGAPQVAYKEAISQKVRNNFV